MKTLAVSHRLALRFLSGRSREPLMSFIGRISMTGMALAVAILVLVLSVMNGFEREFRERILGMVPHATLTFPSALDNWQSYRDALRNSPGVVDAFPFVQTEALAVRGVFAEPMVLIGLEDEQIAQQYNALISSVASSDVSTTSDNNLSGHVDSRDKSDTNPERIPLESHEVILGDKLATALGVDVGSAFRLILPDTQGVGASSGLKFGTTVQSLTVAATLSTGTELDSALALMSIDALSAVKHRAFATLVDGVMINVDQLFDARRIASESAYSQSLPVSITDWTYQYGNLYMAIQLSRQMVVVLLAAIVAIAAFNIFVTLGMSVRHRRREIAVLRTLGMTRGGIRTTFCLKGLYIFLPGFFWGAVFGVALAFAAPSIVGLVESLWNIEFLNTDVYPIDYLPSEIRLTDLVTIFFVALFISMFATLIPAWRASMLAPASVLN